MSDTSLFEKFNSSFDLEGLKADVTNAASGGDYEDVHANVDFVICDALAIRKHAKHHSEYDFAGNLSEQQEGQKTHQVIADSALLSAVKLELPSIDKTCGLSAKAANTTRFI